MPIQTECGLVIYITNTFEIYRNVYNSLKKLQHRGRESFGIGYISDTSNKNYTNFQNNIVEKYGGIVDENKLSDSIKRINSKIWYGHVRYSTSGIKSNNLNFTQPIQYSLFDLDDISIIYNGNIPLKEWEKVFNNYVELKSFYYRNKSSINDTFLILEFLKLLKNQEIEKILKTQHQKNFNLSIKDKDQIIENCLIEFIKNIERAFSLVIITNNKSWVIRDKFGTRPLTLGKLNNGLVIASESCSFNENTQILYDIQPGSLNFIDNFKLEIKNCFNYELSNYNSFKSGHKYCLFEYLYFMRSETTANSINVREFRIGLGKLLVKELKEYHSELYDYFENNKKKNNIDSKKSQILVCGIPKSGIIQAESFANTLNIEYVQFIKQKKEYPHRTFILENDNKRTQACHEKYFIELEDQIKIKDKILILIDDSIVRGNTVKYLVNFINSFKPQEIHFMVSAPPIINVCNYGVDFPNIEELIINKKTVNEFKKYLNIKSLTYLKNNLLNNIQNNKFCLECFNH